MRMGDIQLFEPAAEKLAREYKTRLPMIAEYVMEFCFCGDFEEVSDFSIDE